VASTAGLAVGDRVIVADCAQASGFRITGIGAGLLSHAAGTNSTGDLGRAFGDDAVALRYIARQYYVGTSSSGVAGENSLWMKDGPDAPVELAENVERFEVLYGEDLNNDYVADVFRNADTVVNFTNVVAIQVHMLTRGNRINETMTATPYNFLGTTTTPADRRIRRVYASTIQLRNRVL
jgi:type IV pilus assembly protein PilW